MNQLENMILNLKKSFQRVNYYYMRRRIDNNKGHTSMGWVCTKDNSTKEIKSLDFYEVKAKQEKLDERN